jgi:hypothetical protein
MHFKYSLPAICFTAVVASILLHAAILAPAGQPETPMSLTPRQPLEATVKAKRVPLRHCATQSLKQCPPS